MEKKIIVIFFLIVSLNSRAQILGGGTTFSTAVTFNQSWITGCPAGGTSLSNQVAFEPTTSMDPCGAPSPACATGTTGSDVWFSFFAQSATASIVAAPSSSFDIAIQAFSGTACPGLTQIGCVDVAGNNAAETLSLTGLTTGTRYYFRIFGATNTAANRTGTYTFCGSAGLGSVGIDTDDDNDGITDVVEGGTDAEGDGIINSLDLDSDNDGIPDIREAGGTDTNGDGIADVLTDTDGDGLVNTYDTDNGGTTIPNTDTDGDGIPNARDLDSENDGVTDIVEAGGVDTNGDGRIDGTFADSDGDGFHNTYDATTGGDAIQYRDTDGDGIPNSRDRDSDNDGIPDVLEALGSDTNNDGIVDGFTDTDGDGLAQTVDGDVTNDGIAENTAAALIITSTDADSDGDPETYLRANADGGGFANPYDLDSDGDGIMDVREAGIIDVTNDGIADGTLGTDGWSDEVDIQQVFNPANTDLGNRPNYLDIDSDDDGIPDNIEGQTTAGYIAPLGTDTDGDGIDNNYDNNDVAFAGGANNGLTPANSDGAGNGDYIDTDTDNDDRNDRIEGWDTNGNGLIDGAEIAYVGTTDTDGDGLLNEYDNDDANSNPTNGTTPSSYPDVIVPGGDRDWRQGLDSDGDGIGNSTDADDDNDGIQDINECTGCSTDVFINGSFETPAVAANTYQQVNQATVTGWNTTAGDGLIEIWGTGFNGVPASAGSNFVELNATQNSTLYQTICLNGSGAFITWSFKHRGRSAIDQADFKIGNSLAALFPQVTATDGTTAWGTYSGIYRVAAGVTNIFLAFSVVSTSGGNQSIGNFLDDIQITVVEECDTDGDGIPNTRDLDSDNDGITDIAEAGGVDTNGDGRIDGAFADTDGDGLHNTYDASTGGDAIQNRDTDGDGIPNTRDLDSDNDGIPDLIEAGGTDANNDGKIDGFTDTDNDGLSQTVDADTNNDGTAESTANALIITGMDADSDGDPDSYPRANQDANGLPNPYDLDSDGDGILDVREAGLTDATGDGIADGTLGTDGWSDTVDALASLIPTNTDGVSRPDYLDIDSDNDGIVDNVEGQATAAYLAPAGTDTDGDGIDNNYDNNDALFAGGLNNGILPVNTEAADLADYMDLDSDNDGFPDSFEGHDTNGDQLPDAGSNANNGISGGTTDADNDGLPDGYDNNTASPDATNGTIANSYPNIDGGTTERDWREVVNTDNAGPANNTDTDDDNDGITDMVESSGFDPLGDADADGIRNYQDSSPGAGLPVYTDANSDGISDAYDADQDGIINSLDLDSDNDGIADLVEAGGVDTNGDGRVDNNTDTDGDGLANVYDTDNAGVTISNLDTDGDGIPNSRDTDSDGDGIPDVIEAGGTDANNDGKIDGYTDTDGDGFAQSVDGDMNNDGTPDNTAAVLIITGTDGNADGRPDSYPRANADVNGLPNPYDLDADGDGILDVREAGFTDTNNDGLVDGTLGADGWSDTIDALVSLNLTNSDGTGRPNYVDLDSDDDGIADIIEGQMTAGYLAPSGTDSDGDGIDNVYDNNDGAFAGAANNGIIPTNTDGADTPDYIDADSDNDAKSDRLEGWDTNGNGLINGAEIAFVGTTDSDGDGIYNEYDNDDVNPVAANGTTPASYPDVNTPGGDRDWRQIDDNDLDGVRDNLDADDDNDGIPDTTEGITDTDGDGIIDSWDLDSDNDGIADIVEAGAVDTNGDGRIDGAFADADGDGFHDTYDGSTGGDAIANRDTDGDGIPNSRDLDSDNDGIPDVVEAGGIDANNDGKIDAFTDTDADGFAQSVDGDANNDGIAENTVNALIITGNDGNSDGQPDTYSRANVDRLGLPNPYDLDADGDGILDTREAGLPDANNDGIADGLIGADGWSDTVDALASLNLPNTDGLGAANYLDIDADDDGLSDNVEGQSTAGYLLPSGVDTDADGIDDVYDNNDAAFAGNVNNGITPYNHDGLDNSDYTDIDSDNDGVNDLKEGNGDINATLTNTADTDGDGLIDQFDIFNLNTETTFIQNNVTLAGMGNAGSATGPTPAGSNVTANQTSGAATNRDWRNDVFVLPVRFIDVIVTASGNIYTIAWTVADEVNVKEYIVERSFDGQIFTDAGIVAYRNNGSATQTYNFNDAALAGNNGGVYYRIREADKDGRYMYSKVVSFRTANKTALVVLGNPVTTNYITMNISCERSGKASLRLIDLNGQVLNYQIQNITKGDNTVRLSANRGYLANGTYIIQAVINGKLFVEKVNINK